MVAITKVRSGKIMLVITKIGCICLLDQRFFLHTSTLQLQLSPDSCIASGLTSYLGVNV